MTEYAKTFTISTVKPTEEGSTSWAGIIKADIDRPNIGQRDATRAAQPGLPQSLLSAVEVFLAKCVDLDLQPYQPPPPGGERKEIGRQDENPDAWIQAGADNNVLNYFITRFSSV